MDDYYKNREKRIREEWFPNHEAMIIEAGKVVAIDWRNPGTFNYSARFLIASNALYVGGDIGSAVYYWNQNINLEFLAGCELHYFFEKCVASEKGKKFEDWDKDKVQEYVEKLFKVRQNKDAEHSFYGEGIFYCMGNKEEWQRALLNDGREIFGDDFDEAMDIGSVISIRCQGHLVALKMIHNQPDAVHD